ncbi:MAG: chromosome segregation protein SMC [Nitrospirae bacterium]|nr:chromosome segregation protein SMC [Nitrospirota bacterium]
MRLRKLEIFGFKTFPEKTILNFQPGITCIVGPNGCGKSNVVDAILWVMGEQSTKTLRGERMEDVIFFGSETRKTLGLAEVTLTIGDIKGDLPSQYSEYSEIEITRRLFRSGESEYLINKVPSRLKDIKEILIDAGIGFKGHSVIEQGRIEKILTSTPEDRRAIIEDTAGIMKYKFRKTEALRKLEATQHNLLRVRDIISEVKRQINSLDRQVRKAREYQELAGQIKEQDISLHALKYTSLDSTLKGLLQREETLKEEEMRAQSDLLSIEAKTEEIRTLIVVAEKDLGHLRQALFDLDREISGNENQLILIENQTAHHREEGVRLITEISKLREDLASLRTTAESLTMEKELIEKTLVERESSILEEERQYESASMEFSSLQERLENARATVFRTVGKITESKNRQTSTQARVSELTRGKERLLTEKGDSSRLLSETLTQTASKEEVKTGLKNSLNEKIQWMTSLSERLSSIEGRTGELIDSLIKKREALHRSEARYHSLEEMEKNLVGYQEGVRSILLSKGQDNPPFKGIHGIVADFLDVQSTFSGTELNSVPKGMGGFSAEKIIEAVLGERLQNIVVDDFTETRKAIEFLKSNSGGRSTFIPLTPRTGGDLPALSGQIPGVIGPAISFIEYKESYKTLVEYLFANIIVVDTLETALTLWGKDDRGYTYVTLDGEIVEPAGRITGGATNGKSQGLIQKRKELRTLQGEVLKLKQEVSGLEEGEERLKKEREILQGETEGLHNHIRNIEISLVNIEKDIAILKDGETRLQLRAETLSLEEREIDLEIERLAGELNRYEAELQGLAAEQGAGEQEIQELIEAQKTGRDRWEDAHRGITAKKLELATYTEKREALSTRLREIEERTGVALQTISEKEESLIKINQKIENQALEKTRIESAISELWQKKEALAREATAKEEERAGRAEEIRVLEESVRERRKVIEGLKNDINQAEIQKTEMRLEMGHLKEGVYAAYQISLEEEIKTLDLQGLDMEKLSVSVTGLKERLQRMGPVNLASIEEYQELNQRYEFLTSQETDLTQACETLHKTISKINMTTKEMFLTTFHVINEKFQHLFQLFFQGGNARLTLTDENNVLESGIEIFAQPPGKKVSQLALLSGGEKALTALSLLFATFLARPTPFCVLDEIDAPLDEANTDRFIRSVRDMTGFSQFVVVTHNKRTMEGADTLYGVTMAEAGVSRIVSVNLSRREWVEEVGLVSASAL